MLWKLSDLPFEFAPRPIMPIFNNVQPLMFFPGWVLVDKNGVAVAQVRTGIDASFIAELMNAKP